MKTTSKTMAAMLAAATLVGGAAMPAAASAAPQPDGPAVQTLADDSRPEVSWTLYGIPFTRGEDGGLVLSRPLPELPEKPERLLATGSDGTPVELTLNVAAESTPLLGVSAGNGTLAAPATNGHPALSADVSWREGKEVTLSDGAKFTPGKDGIWHANYGHELELRADNTAPVENLGLSDGSKTRIEWSDPTLDGGKVIRTGIANGQINGQSWEAAITASRATDHASLRQTITAASKALEEGKDEYTTASRNALADAIKEADQLDKTPATDDALNDMRDRLAEAVGKLDAITWNVDGIQLAHEPGKGYEGKGANPLDTAPAASVTLSSNDPQLGDSGSATISRVKDDAQPEYENVDLGVIRATGTAHYEGVTPNGDRKASWSQDYSYTVGERAQAAGPDGKRIGFTVASGYLSATVTASLDQANQPKDATVTIDGKPVNVIWSSRVNTRVDSTTSTYTRQGRAEGDITIPGTGQSQHWVVYVTASRTEGKVAGLSVIQRQADGTSVQHQLDGFDPAKTDYAITLPADAVADQYTLGHTSAAGDRAEVSEGRPIPPTLGEGASRILKTTLNGVTYTVTVNFEQARPTPDNPNARLTGLYVNLTGKAEKGALIDGWNPDVLDYTIRIGANDPGAYILPEAGAGVTITAGDVIRTGYATTQYWTTTVPDGQSRTYSVTVIRDHEQPTAEEAFTPAAAADVDGRTPAASRSDTSLVSHGYLLDGEYHAVEATDYVIPEGGAFAYASKQGQTVQVSESKTKGMTWRYTLNILAPDGVTLANPAPAFTVTYLTGATNEASITGIIVDGKPISGFDPAKHEYETQVDNIDHWTVTADFDKSTGMGVTIHKNHADATITAVSADGLNKTTYTLKVGEKPLSLNRNGLDGATVESLPHTGVNTQSLISVIAVLLAAGVACLAAGVTRRRRKARRRTPDAPDDGKSESDAPSAE